MSIEMLVLSIERLEVRSWRYEVWSLEFEVGSFQHTQKQQINYTPFNLLAFSQLHINSLPDHFHRM